MRLPVSWLRDFVDVQADTRQIADRLAACGFEVAAIEGDVIDLEITANRPDCLTITGLAREVATAFDLPLRASGEPFPFAHAPALEDSLSSRGPRALPGANQAPLASRNVDTPAAIPVTIENDGCGRFALAVVDVVVGPSPAWLADRLTAAGLRPINNVVDVTNYVMLETHPMHAYDAVKLAGPEIHVRLARPGERLTTLDGQTRTLDDTMLVVADRERPAAIAGVMGGAASEVSGGTSRIALESAWWQPAQVRLTSRRLSLKTEAAARFERGADTEGPVRAIDRALALFAAIGAGQPIGAVLDVYPRHAPPVTVGLRRDRLRRLLGDAVPDREIERILTRLGFALTQTADGWHARVPTFRVDIRREPDLIEEIGRHWGLDRIPATFPPLRSAPPLPVPAISRGRAARGVLTGAGFQEAATFTFIEQAAAAPFVPDPAQLVEIANPLSEKFAVLRPSLLPGLLDALIYSRRRETANVRLFEAGAVFGPRGERQAVGWVMTGTRGDHWGTTSEPVDFFDAKGTAELLAHAFRASLEAEVADIPWFVPGRAARLVATDGSELGVIGQLRPELADARGQSDGEPIVAGEIDMAALVSAGSAVARRVAPLPRYPSVVRDLSIVVDERLPAATVRGTILAAAPPTLVGIREFDRYQGRGVPLGQVSLSIRLTFRAPDRTLTDAEVQQATGAIVDVLAREHAAVLRGSGS